MKLKFYFNILVVCFPFLAFAQDGKFELTPFMNGVTTINEGIIEAGIELNKAKSLLIRPTIRVPLTDKKTNTLQIDRFTSTWRGVVLAQKTFHKTEESGAISMNSFALQGEYGFTNFKYFPNGIEEQESKEGNSSYGLELKWIGYFTEGVAYAKQFSPQIRLRYSYDWKAAPEVGVLNQNNGSGVSYTTDMIIEKPTATPMFSPALALQFYPGDGYFSYSPVLYWDFFGEKNKSNPFNNSARLRFESWIFYFPLISDNANFKIGLTPFISIRTKGDDNFNRIEYGGQVSIKASTTFLQFL